ncbi:MAG: hypothetical protein EXR49_02905 [Dehalococcoidia bacterium]|nr:hypothetical protein [Dehalococcoidia bacterium]
MATLTIVNPVAEPKADALSGGRFQPAKRSASLDGKTVGLFWNAKAGGDVALARTKENLARLYPKATFVDILAAHGSHMRQASKGQVEELSKRIHAIVGSTSD